MEEHSFNFKLIVESSVERPVTSFLIVDNGVAPASQVPSNLMVKACFREESESGQSCLGVFAKGHV